MKLKKVKNILKIILVAVPVLVLFRKLSPLEIYDPSLSSILNWTICIVYILCIPTLISVIIYELNQRDKALMMILMLFVNIAYFGICFCLLFFVFFASVCGTHEEDILISKSSEERIKRSWIDCGAWDSGYPLYNYIKVNNITSWVRIVHKIDTNTINKNEWIKVAK